MASERNAAQRELQALKAACRTQVQQLDRTMHFQDIPDIRTLCDAIARQRGRRIHLEALPLPPQETGFWLADHDGDTIYYARDASLPYQEHIILHELAHILRNHRPLATEIELLQRQWFPLLDPERLRTLLGRSHYDHLQEREAELLASLIEQRWRRVRPKRGVDEDGHAAPPAIRWLREQARWPE